MSCEDVTRALAESSSSSVLPSAVWEHVHSCGRCEQLLQVFDTPAEELDSSDAIRRIQEQLLRDLKPVRTLAGTKALFFRFLVIAAAIVAVAVWRLGAGGVAVLSPMQLLVIVSTLGIAIGLLAYSLTQQMVPGRFYWFLPLLPAAIVAMLLIETVSLFDIQAEKHFWASALVCLTLGMFLAVVAAIPFALVLRKGAILQERMTGLTAGLLAGLVGVTTLELHCPNLDLRHILVAHLGVALLALVAGLLRMMVHDSLD